MAIQCITKSLLNIYGFLFQEDDLDFWMNNNSTAAAKSTDNEIVTPEVSVEYANVSSEEDSQKEKVKGDNHHIINVYTHKIVHVRYLLMYCISNCWFRKDTSGSISQF